MGCDLFDKDILKRKQTLQNISPTLRFPDQNKWEDSECESELWLINKKAWEKKLVERDRMLTLKVEEFYN